MDAFLTSTGLSSSQLGGALAAIGVGAVLISKMFASSASSSTSSGSSGQASKKSKAKQKQPKKQSMPKEVQPNPTSNKIVQASGPKLSKSQKKRAKQKQKEEANAGTGKKQGSEKSQNKSKAAPQQSQESEESEEDDFFAALQGNRKKKNKRVEKKPSGPLSEKQKRAAKRQEQARVEEERKETARTLTLQGAVPAPLSNLERWDTAGFEVVGSKKKKRSPKSNASTPGGNLSVSRRSGAIDTSGTSGSTSAELEIDPRHFGLIIGEKGATLMKLQAEHDVQIDVPKRDDAKKTVTISSSSKDSINKARQAIKLLIQGGSAVSELFCPPAKIGVVIGPGGKNIKALQEAFKVRVNTPDRNSGSNKVIITGEKPGVKGAKEAVKMLIAQGFSPATHPGWVMQEVEVEFEYFRFVIGPGGQTIKSIQGDTKTRINLPQTPNGASSAVTVVGPKDGVERAIVQIERAVARGRGVAQAAEESAAAAGASRSSYALDANDPNAFSDEEF